jgi:hypothetical protein
MQPLHAVIKGLRDLEIWLTADLGVRHPSYETVHELVVGARAELQRAINEPHGDAADAENASRQMAKLTALRSILHDLDPKPADLIDLEDRLDWLCRQLLLAGGTPGHHVLPH